MASVVCWLLHFGSVYLSEGALPHNFQQLKIIRSHPQRRRSRGWVTAGLGIADDPAVLQLCLLQLNLCLLLFRKLLPLLWNSRISTRHFAGGLSVQQSTRGHQDLLFKHNIYSSQTHMLSVISSCFLNASMRLDVVSVICQPQCQRRLIACKVRLYEFKEMPAGQASRRSCSQGVTLTRLQLPSSCGSSSGPLCNRQQDLPHPQQDNVRGSDCVEVKALCSLQLGSDSKADKQSALLIWEEFGLNSMKPVGKISAN